MEITIENFESFMDSNISGKFIVNPYWLEHLLNLFSQDILERFGMRYKIQNESLWYNRRLDMVQ